MMDYRTNKCWNSFCIAENHPNDNNHVDATGYTWTESKQLYPDTSTEQGLFVDKLSVPIYMGEYTDKPNLMFRISGFSSCDLCNTLWPVDALSYSHMLDMTLCPLHPSYKPSGK